MSLSVSFAGLAEARYVRPAVKSRSVADAHSLGYGRRDNTWARVLPHWLSPSHSRAGFGRRAGKRLLSHGPAATCITSKSGGQPTSMRLSSDGWLKLGPKPARYEPSPMRSA